MPLAALAGGLIGGSLLEALGRKTTILFIRKMRYLYEKWIDVFTLCGSFYHFSSQLLSNTSKDVYIYLCSEGYLSISGILCLSHFHFAEAYCRLTGIFFPKYICAAIKKARVLRSISLDYLHFNSKINASSY